MGRFNRAAAIKYASQYAITPNNCFPPYPNDCTSFVSQCMLAGGWPMLGGSVFDRTDDTVWWWGKSLLTNASYTWGGAHNFSRFVALSGRGKICTRAEASALPRIVSEVAEVMKSELLEPAEHAVVSICSRRPHTWRGNTCIWCDG